MLYITYLLDQFIVAMIWPFLSSIVYVRVTWNSNLIDEHLPEKIDKSLSTLTIFSKAI